MRWLTFLRIVIGVAVALGLAVVPLSQSSVGAQPIAGATYTGTVSVGGSVEFTVSADGTEVTHYSWEISAGSCGWLGTSSSIPIDNDAFVYAFPFEDHFAHSFSGSFPSPGAAEGTITVDEASPPCDFVTWTATTDATLVPSPTPSPTPVPTPTPDQMHNCPEVGKWSIATWSGQDGMPIDDALAFCPQQVNVAYRINPATQAWSRYFSGRPEISNLTALDDCQGVIALGAGVSAASTAGDESPGATANGMLGCPLQGKWAISVWDGDDGTDAEQALGTCGEGAVAVAYSIDPDTQMWSRWFAGRPEISNLTALNNMQGVMALGGTRTPAEGRIAFHSNRDFSLEIYVMNADGTNVTRLTDNPARFDDPTWSPDGSKIAFVSGVYCDIYVMDADGTNQTCLTNNASPIHAPRWSPDGSRIAYILNGLSRDIYVIDTDGSNERNLTNNPADDFDPAWSPDGSKIAFVSERDGDGDIYVMNADGSGVVRLTDAGGSRPTWSPDGSKIAFESDRDGNPEIYVMDADGSNETNLTNNAVTDRSPAWSP